MIIILYFKNNKSFYLMGRGNDEAVARKLIRNYFRFDLKRKNFNTAKPYYQELMSCWKTNGKDSKEEDIIQQKIDMAMANDEKEFYEMKKIVKKYPLKMNQMLAKEKNKYLTKGHDPQHDRSINEPTKKIYDMEEDFYNMKF